MRLNDENMGCAVVFLLMVVILAVTALILEAYK